MAKDQRDSKGATPAKAGWRRWAAAEFWLGARRLGMWALAALVLGGSFVFFSEWTIWSWLYMGGLGLMIVGWPRDWWAGWRESVLLRAVTWWVGWMLLSSWWQVGAEGSEMGTPRVWLWGAVGLLAWVMSLHWVGREERLANRLGLVVVGLALLSAVVSVIEYGWLRPEWHWGMRLSNGLVYGGWNQVCSGVTWALAAVWALVLEPRQESKVWLRRAVVLAHVVLIFVAMATLSRGALLMLLVGHLAWGIGMRKRAIWGIARFAMVMTVFHLVMPGLVTEAGPETEVSRRYPRVIDANPLKEWTKRADTGRLVMYAAVGKAVTGGTVRELLLGQGAWADNTAWHQHLQEERPMHPHSVFLGTALQGGVVGLAGLLTVIGLGLWMAWRVGRTTGWPGYAVLALAGLAGVTFDGHSLLTLNSVPRYEPLLVWTGLFLASGQWWTVMRQRKSCE